MKKSLALLMAVFLLLSVCGCTGKATIPEDARAVLHKLGGEEPTPVKNGTIHDNLVKDPAMTVTWDDSYALFNESGEIVRIKCADTSTAFSSVDALIAYLEENLIGEEYEQVESYDFSRDTLSVRYEKILFPGATDQYDYVAVHIHKPLAKLETFYRTTSGFRLKAGDTVIGEEAALAAANTRLEEKETVTDVKLTTVKPTDSAAEDSLRLAYVISTERRMIYVDAYTAEILGGDVYK